MLNYNGTALQVLLTSTCTSALPALWSGLLEQIPNELIVMWFLKHYRKRGLYLFTVLSFFPPTSLLFLIIQKENTYMPVYRHMQHPPQQTLWKPGPLCFVFLSEDEFSYGFPWCPERVEAFPSVGHHPSCQPLFSPCYLQDAYKGISKSFLPLLWVEPASRYKSCSRKREKPGRQSWTHMLACTQRGSMTTCLISVGNQIKKQSTLCQA